MQANAAPSFAALHSLGLGFGSSRCCSEVHAACPSWKTAVAIAFSENLKQVPMKSWPHRTSPRTQHGPSPRQQIALLRKPHTSKPQQFSPAAEFPCSDDKAKCGDEMIFSTVSMDDFKEATGLGERSIHPFAIKIMHTTFHYCKPGDGMIFPANTAKRSLSCQKR